MGEVKNDTRYKYYKMAQKVNEFTLVINYL